MAEVHMKQKGITFFFIALGVMLISGSVFLFSVTPAQAQCGSQASSCKNCHETQGQDPVNNDGTTWHSQHAFGDFCYLCHAGNNQATDETAAHTGMVDPLADVATSCMSCHPKDYESLAQDYATTLGVTLGSGGAAPTAAASEPSASAATATLAPAAAVPASDMVDYSQRYDEVALGKKPANVGNIIAIVLIAALLLGGGYLVLRREGWIKISFQETKQIQGSYPADVVDLVPEIAKLKPAARKDLRQVLSKPSTAAELFALVAKLIKKEDSPAQEETQKQK
jgi:hypothetical protein